MGQRCRCGTQFADGPWLTVAAMKWFWDAYLPNKADRKKTMAAPLAATVEQLKGLPPALLIVDENDILRDEGEEYARKLIQAGVETLKQLPFARSQQSTTSSC
jgi:acetyl esterase/lipase